MPKTRENEIKTNFFEKTGNFCLTDRIIDNSDEIVMKLNNTLNKTKKSRHEKCASNDFTLKKASNGMIDEEDLNKSKVIRCKNNKECTRHQKSYRFNLEDASAKEIELFENVRFFSWNFFYDTTRLYFLRDYIFYDTVYFPIFFKGFFHYVFIGFYLFLMNF